MLSPKMSRDLKRICTYKTTESQLGGDAPVFATGMRSPSPGAAS